ncbi:MAG: hypothetical protein NXI10_02870 [bacterium]|nr:hypothetical protein [bacterium]
MKGRSIAAVIGGIVAGVFIMYLFNLVVDKVYPPDWDAIRALKGDPKKIADYLRDMPAGFHLMGILGGLLRLIVGMFTGSFIDKENLMTPIVIAAFFLLLAVLDSFVLPHPGWYALTYLPLMILTSIGYVWMKRKG